ncbi:hypothetical protein [Paenibacillus sp. sgz302251]|uniref:hypothetical protein n=1 Tax=Paenibacillus sp. sgz302251 TaxID=3414493 RepID=UPI003C7DDD1A
MIIKWMLIAAIIGFIVGIMSGTGFQGGLSGAFIFAVIAVPVRKWVLRTFWE